MLEKLNLFHKVLVTATLDCVCVFVCSEILQATTKISFFLEFWRIWRSWIGSTESWSSHLWRPLDSWQQARPHLHHHRIFPNHHFKSCSQVVSTRFCVNCFHPGRQVKTHPAHVQIAHTIPLQLRPLPQVIHHHRHRHHHQVISPTIPIILHRLRRVGGQGPVFQSSTQFGGKRHFDLILHCCEICYKCESTTTGESTTTTSTFLRLNRVTCLKLPWNF